MPIDLIVGAVTAALFLSSFRFRPLQDHSSKLVDEQRNSGAKSTDYWAFDKSILKINGCKVEGFPSKNPNPTQSTQKQHQKAEQTPLWLRPLSVDIAKQMLRNAHMKSKKVKQFVKNRKKVMGDLNR